jgi:hypothetical protein
MRFWVSVPVLSEEYRQDDGKLFGEQRHADRDPGQRRLDPAAAQQAVEQDDEQRDRGATHRAPCNDPGRLAA